MMNRGTIYPYRIDSTVGRAYEPGGALTPALSGMNAWKNNHRFKANLLSEPFNHPGNQIQGFRTTGQGGANDHRIMIGAALNRRELFR